MANPDTRNESRLMRAWARNAAAWTRAVREGRIASRQRVTNAAIIDLIESRPYRSLLDVGCGEGWLIRALSRPGLRLVGVDASSALVAAAQDAGGGEYHCLDYAQLADALDGCFDVIVCNFSLLGRHSTEQALAAAAGLLAPAGRLLIQTLHPGSADGDAAEGWLQSGWDACGTGFVGRLPWYRRDREAWRRALSAAGLRLRQQCQSIDPDSGRPLSLLLVATRAASE